MRYAEEANYFQTTVHPAASQGEIAQMLDEFGATAIMTATGEAGGRYAWAIRFQWMGRAYRFKFTPLTCRTPNKVYSFSGKKRTAAEQARYQMGRIAVNMVKAVLTAAEADPDALFGFLEIPGGTSGGLPPTAAELDVTGLTGLLEMPKFPLLGDGE